jgi:GH35 family endo-1,4-beta-xylanase
MNSWLKGEEKDFDRQGDTFSAVLGALLERRESGVVTWNVWNVSDADAWRQEEKKEGCLFDRQYRAKPAYYSLQKILENPPAAKGR